MQHGCRAKPLYYSHTNYHHIGKVKGNWNKTGSSESDSIDFSLDYKQITNCLMLVTGQESEDDLGTGKQVRSKVCWDLFIKGILLWVFF